MKDHEVREHGHNAQPTPDSIAIGVLGTPKVRKAQRISFLMHLGPGNFTNMSFGFSDYVTVEGIGYQLKVLLKMYISLAYSQSRVHGPCHYPNDGV